MPWTNITKLQLISGHACAHTPYKAFVHQLPTLLPQCVYLTLILQRPRRRPGGCRRCTTRKQHFGSQFHLLRKSYQKMLEIPNAPISSMVCRASFSRSLPSPYFLVAGCHPFLRFTNPAKFALSSSSSRAEKRHQARSARANALRSRSAHLTSPSTTTSAAVRRRSCPRRDGRDPSPAATAKATANTGR